MTFFLLLDQLQKHLEHENLDNEVQALLMIFVLLDPQCVHQGRIGKRMSQMNFSG